MLRACLLVTADPGTHDLGPDPVGLLSSRAIPSAQATAWIADANRIRAVIGS